MDKVCMGVLYQLVCSDLVRARSTGFVFLQLSEEDLHELVPLIENVKLSGVFSKCTVLLTLQLVT